MIPTCIRRQIGIIKLVEIDGCLIDWSLGDIRSSVTLMETMFFSRELRARE